MGIRIQPREIDVPQDDPFKEDLLGRKKPAEVLTHLIGNFEGPCVLAVDAAWGNGKTTFLKMWSQYLRNDGFSVVEFNAWETDFSGDPFIALSTEMEEGLQKYREKSLVTEKVDNVVEQAKKVAQRAVPGLIRFATSGTPGVASVGSTLASYVEDKLSEYREAQKSVKAFKQTLQDMAETLSESNKNRPLIVVIDELDRCRPSYAVELLEVAKHLFAVDHIVFVLAVNRSQLAHSVKALYGSDFDAVGYLRRFFDVDFRLPEPERDAFINATFNAIRIENYFIRTDDQRPKHEAEWVRKMLLGFFGAPDLSLRRIAQALHRLGLVFTSLRSDHRSFAVAAAVAMILRTIDVELYHRFLDGEVSDLEVVDKMRARAGVEAILREDEGRLFEAAIILAARELRRRRAPLDWKETPLWERYQAAVSKSQADPPEERGQERAKHVIRLVNVYQQQEAMDSSAGVGFRHAVDRLEMVSSDLIEEPAAERGNS